jgi:hypothetical protein
MCGEHRFCLLPQWRGVGVELNEGKHKCKLAKVEIRVNPVQIEVPG